MHRDVVRDERRIGVELAVGSTIEDAREIADDEADVLPLHGLDPALLIGFRTEEPR